MKAILISFAITTWVMVNIDGASSSFETENRPQRRHVYWVNAEYSRCLKGNLPCDCIGENEYLIADVDLGYPLEVALLYKTIDQDFLHSKVRKSKSGIAYVTEGISSRWELLYKFKNDTLFVTDGPFLYTFHRIPEYDRIAKMEDVLSTMNLNSLKKKCNSKNFDVNTKLGIDDNVNFFCNLDKGFRNVVQTEGRCTNKWIVKKKGDTILFLKYKNSCADKTNPVTIDEELIFEVSIN